MLAGIDGEDDLHELAQGAGEVFVGQLVANLAAFVGGDDQSAATQAGEVVGNVGAAQFELVGQLPGVPHTVQEGDQDLAAGRIREGAAEPGQGGATGFTGQHWSNNTPLTDMSVCLSLGKLRLVIEKQPRSPERLVFFSDAVVAIALTLLVLPLTEIVPDLIAEHAPASEAITHNWTKILSFLLSFAVIGRFWLVHHGIFEHVRSYSRALVLVNFCWLFTIAALPFPTELIGAYQSQRFTVVFYLSTLFACSLCHTALAFIIRHDPTVRGDADPVTRRWTLNLALSTVVFALAVLVAFIRPGFGYYVLLLLSLPPLVARLMTPETPVQTP